jgi:hypothetical protein
LTKLSSFWRAGLLTQLMSLRTSAVTDNPLQKESVSAREVAPGRLGGTSRSFRQAFGSQTGSGETEMAGATGAGALAGASPLTAAIAFLSCAERPRWVCTIARTLRHGADAHRPQGSAFRNHSISVG